MFSRIILVLWLLVLNIFAQVKFDLPKFAIANEAYIFSIEAIGEEVEFPLIKNIGSFAVQEVSSSTSRSIINSTITKKIKKTFTLYPKNDFIIPSYSFKIDGNIVKTDEKNIVLQKTQKTISDIFDLKISTSKTELFVGENFILTIVLKFKKNTQILDMAFQNPNFQNFWFKQLNDTKRYSQGAYEVQELKFLMIPLKDGNIQIPPLSIVAQILDSSKTNSMSFFSNITKNEKIYSNSIALEVKKLPEDVKLIGNFKIESTIDKNQINFGEAISYKVKIEGSGNIEDIPDLKLELNDATVYENKPNIQTRISDNDLVGIYEKVFSIVPNKSITIPKITLKYYDKKTNSIKFLESKEYEVKVNQVLVNNTEKNSLEKIEPKQIITEEKIVYKSSIEDKILYFVLGILLSVIILVIYFYINSVKKSKQVYNTPLIKRIKSVKSKDELLKILAIYINIDKNLDDLIFKLEKCDDIKSLKKEIEKKIIELKL